MLKMHKNQRKIGGFRAKKYLFTILEKSSENKEAMTDDGSMFMIIAGIVLLCSIVVGAIYSDYIIYFINAVPFLSSFTTLSRKIKPMMGGSGRGDYDDGEFIDDPFDLDIRDLEDDNISIVTDEHGSDDY